MYICTKYTTNFSCKLRSSQPSNTNTYIHLTLTVKSAILYPTFKHFFFFFNHTATTEIYPLPLHDPLPILGEGMLAQARVCFLRRARVEKSINPGMDGADSFRGSPAALDPLLPDEPRIGQYQRGPPQAR